MKNLFFGIAVLSVFGLASAASCTDETSGDGGAGGTSDGGNGTGATGGMGTGGSTSSCAGCYAYVEAALSGTAFDTSTMCGYEDDPTDPSSSYGILLALGECTCDPTGGDCGAVCELTCTGAGMDTDPDCGNCQMAAIGAGCASEFNACSADVNGTGE